MSELYDYIARIMGSSYQDRWSLPQDFIRFLAVFGVYNWSPSTAVPGSYRAGRWHNCVLARSPWAAAVVLASVESDRPTEELLALASVLLSTGEVEFMHRAARD